MPRSNPPNITPDNTETAAVDYAKKVHVVHEDRPTTISVQMNGVDSYGRGIKMVCGFTAHPDAVAYTPYREGREQYDKSEMCERCLHIVNNPMGEQSMSEI